VCVGAPLPLLSAAQGHSSPYNELPVPDLSPSSLRFYSNSSDDAQLLPTQSAVDDPRIEYPWASLTLVIVRDMQLLELFGHI